MATPPDSNSQSADPSQDAEAPAEVLESTFDKYADKGAYHYNYTIGAPSWRDYNPRLAARYLTAVKLLDVHRGDSVLDAGSGEGVAALLCCRRGAKATAVELDPVACRLGEEIGQREGFGADRIVFQRNDLYRLHLEDESHDKVVSLEVIEHMHDVPAYLRELLRVLKPGGRIVVSTPLRSPDGKLSDRFHVVEYDAASLRTALAEVFSEVEVFSGWGAKLEAWWRSNRPFAAVAKIQRLFIRIPAYFGWNLFVGTTPPSNGGPLLFGTGRKPVR